MDSDDGLLEGETRQDDVVAAAVGGERAKRKAKSKDDTESDEVPVSKGARRASKSVTGSNKGKCRAEPVSKRKRNAIAIGSRPQVAAQIRRGIGATYREMLQAHTPRLGSPSRQPERCDTKKSVHSVQASNGSRFQGPLEKVKCSLCSPPV